MALSTCTQCNMHFKTFQKPLLAQARPLAAGPGRLKTATAVRNLSYALDSSSDDSCDALDSEDLVYAALPLRRAAAVQTAQYTLQHRHPQPIPWQQLSLAAAEHTYPWVATAYFAAAASLIAAPHQSLELLFGTSAAAGDPLLVTSFVQLLGGAYLLQGATAVIVKGCAERGQLHGTTCQRMLLASLLAMTGNIMSLGKVAVGAASGAPALWLSVLLATFCAHVACHLPHHPWFLVKVLWPVATTMIITDLFQLLPAVMAGSGGVLGAGRLQAMLAALLSVKIISKLSRVAAGAAPRVFKRLLGPASSWLAKRSTRLLPLLARRLGGAAQKITRLGGRLVGRMAPRYAKDQLAGRTMHMAFHDADTGMTQTVAKSIDLLPPKTPAGIFYTVLLALQLAMIANAYCPGLLFRLPVMEAAAAAAEIAQATAGAAAATAATEATAVGVTAAAAVDLAVGISDPILRLVKYAWGSGFFIAAFGFNCLKTAADRHHCWAPQNRQLAAALAAMQGVTAWVLLTGMRAGAVIPGIYTFGSMGLAAAGACFCAFLAATSNSTQQWAGSAANSAAGSVLSSSLTGDAVQQTDAANTGSGVTAVWQGGQQQVLLNAAGAAAFSAAAAAECSGGAVPLSSAECEKREHAEPEYAAFTSATVLLLTLLQLAL